ncbi:DUF1516 family protein [Alkalicoccobacillus murimartini]|uniref:Membrane protein implicated in regulation of membrane protease activity n=1 Tax=Alkalicoccobacillus murimartini TaxID=171685 RepID=A0ABT9YJC5_9BACI|nr:DUF1516 family protein [Alkalicoccobacillus murimartini]MDQ0207967.1 membrane protein implicated in regulation of membrane protease activity [Alkalicoccobacillus murimartini]
MDAQTFLLYYKVHIGTWMLLILLFGVLFLLYKWKVSFANRLLRTILWLLYSLSIVSGVAILYVYQFPAQYIIKGMISLILIYSMEVILRKTKRKQRGTSIYWFICITALSIVLLLGFNIGMSN